MVNRGAVRKLYGVFVGWNGTGNGDGYGNPPSGRAWMHLVGLSCPRANKLDYKSQIGLIMHTHSHKGKFIRLII